MANKGGTGHAFVFLGVPVLAKIVPHHDMSSTLGLRKWSQIQLATAACCLTPTTAQVPSFIPSFPQLVNAAPFCMNGSVRLVHRIVSRERQVSTDCLSKAIRGGNPSFLVHSLTLSLLMLKGSCNNDTCSQMVRHLGISSQGHLAGGAL